MSPVNASTALRAAAHRDPARAADVRWFAESSRLIGGRPDTRYGWLQRPDGPCIVKALDAGLTAYAGTLLQHERSMLRRLSEIGAPAPALIETGREDWIATRFAGLSLHRLAHPAGLPDAHPPGPLPFAEQLAAWVHLLQRLRPMAERGVLAIDLWAANVLLPLTGGTRGQLRLAEPALIDHAHTVEAGLGMRRPLWLDPDMRRIAPELREAIKRDQRALQEAFAAVGADLPGYSRMPTERDDHNRRTWAQYDAPQQLQRLLDAGDLRCDPAMQFAAGTAMGALLSMAPDPAQRQALAEVLRRMTAADAAARHASLGDAADALSSVLPALPMVSEGHYAPVQPQHLCTPAVTGRDHGADGASRRGPLTATRAADAHTAQAAPSARDTASSSAEPPASRKPPARSDSVPPVARPRRRAAWLLATVAAGAALGAALPFPWL